MVETDARRTEFCTRIEENVRDFKRQRNDLERQIQQAEGRKPELSRRRRSLEDSLQELDRMAMASRARSRRPRGHARPGTEAADAVSAVAIENEKAKIQNQIAAIDREISGFERSLAELRRRRDEKHRLIRQSQTIFNKHRCGELGFSWETLNLN